MNVLRPREWRHEVEVRDVHSRESHIFSGYDAIEKEFYYQHFGGGRTHLAWVVDAVAANNEPCSILFGFLGTDATQKLAVCDFFHAVARDFTLVDKIDGVGAFDAATHTIYELCEFVC